MFAFLNSPGIMRAALQEASQDLLVNGISEITWELISLPIRLVVPGILDPHVLQPSARMAALINVGMHGTVAVGVPAEVLAKLAPYLHGTLI